MPLQVRVICDQCNTLIADGKQTEVMIRRIVDNIASQNHGTLEILTVYFCSESCMMIHLDRKFRSIITN